MRSMPLRGLHAHVHDVQDLLPCITDGGTARSKSSCCNFGKLLLGERSSERYASVGVTSEPLCCWLAGGTLHIYSFLHTAGCSGLNSMLHRHEYEALRLSAIGAGSLMVVTVACEAAVICSALLDSRTNHRCIDLSG